MSRSSSVRRHAASASQSFPTGDQSANRLSKPDENGQMADGEYAFLRGEKYMITGKTPTSSASQASTCSTDGSMCGTLSDVSLSSSSAKSTAFSERTNTTSASTETTVASHSSPAKSRTRAPSLDVIAARLRKVDLKADQAGEAQSGSEGIQQITPVRPTATHAFPSNACTPSAKDMQSLRGRSDALASLVDRAACRSRSTSPVKRETAPTMLGTPSNDHRRGSTSSSLKEVPSLQDIVMRIGSRKDASSTSTSPALGPSPTPPRTPSRGSTTPQLKERGTDTTEDVNHVSGQKNPSKQGQSKPNEHPLQNIWSIYFDSKSWNPSASQGSVPPKSPVTVSSASSSNAQSWEATLKLLGQYRTVESFMPAFSTLRRPSQLERNSNYHLFKNGIKPMWEDPGNVNGGKWIITLRTSNPALLDRSWLWLAMALIGETLDDLDDVTGAVVSTRAKGDRIALWIRDKSDVNLVNKIGQRLVALLELEREPGVSLEFTANMLGDVGNSSSGSLRSSLCQDSPSKYLAFSNPVASLPHGVGLTPHQKGFGRPHQPPQTSHMSNTSALQQAQQQSLHATLPGSPIQMHGTLGAHLRLHNSPSKGSASSNSISSLVRSPSTSGAMGRRGSQDPEAGSISGLGFSIGFGGPIGRTNSPSPAPKALRGGVATGPELGLMNRAKVGSS